MHELALLDSAAATADLVAQLQAEVDKSGVIVEGRTNPVLVELRLQRLTLGRLLAQLQFPDADDQATGQRRPVRRVLRRAEGGVQMRRLRPRRLALLAAGRPAAVPPRLRTFDPAAWGAEAGATDVELRAAAERYVRGVGVWCEAAGHEFEDVLRARAESRVVAASGGPWGRFCGPAACAALLGVEVRAAAVLPVPGDDEWPPADEETKG